MKNKKIIAILSILCVIAIIIIVISLNKKSSMNAENVIETGTVTIKYVDNEGNSLGEESISGKVGDWYETQRKDFEFYYAYGDEPINKKGYYESEEITVTYTYIKEDYISTQIDENNNIIIDISNHRQSKELDMKIVATLTTQEETTNLSDATFKVTKDSEPIKQGQTLENGELFVGTITARNEETTVFTIEALNIDSQYEIEFENPFTVTLIKTWNESKSEYEVSLEYDTSMSGLTVSLEDDELIITVNFIEVETVEPVQEYDLSMQYFITSVDTELFERAPTVSVNESGEASYSQNKDTVSVANEQTVTLEARIYNNSSVAADGQSIKIEIPEGFTFNSNDETNIKYNWKMYKTNEYGVLVETTNADEAEVVITDYLTTMQINGYDYTNSETPNYEAVQIVFTVNESALSGTRNIVTTAEIINTLNDTNNDNDKDSEYLYVKYFDLQLQKYIQSVDITDDEETKTITVGEENKDEITKIDIASSKINSTSLSIEYGIEVKNVGEIAGMALEVTDYIPEGLTFDQAKNPDWYEEDNCIKTTILNNVILEPGESKILTVILDWNLDESSVGEKINNAEISLYYNENNAVDITNENKDSEKIIITVKTGKAIYITITVALIILVVVSVFIITEKKSNKGGNGKHE